MHLRDLKTEYNLIPAATKATVAGGSGGRRKTGKVSNSSKKYTHQEHIGFNMKSQRIKHGFRFLLSPID